MKFSKATQRLLDSVWTLTFIQKNEDSVEVLDFNRADADGYRYERRLPKLETLEGPERVLEEVLIDGRLFIVANPAHIFSYKNKDIK
jgi:hypothetical protein|tara:strand:+ start:334 stop:594 length:261 start_codon:yes stop_codon:yes gene_type:complete